LACLLFCWFQEPEFPIDIFYIISVELLPFFRDKQKIHIVVLQLKCRGASVVVGCARKEAEETRQENR
jgi:hypothetical protein